MVLLLTFVLTACSLTYRQSEVEVSARPNLVPEDVAERDRARGEEQVWSGIARNEIASAGIRIRFERVGDAITGQFYLGKVGADDYGYLDEGKLEGTLIDGVLDAVVISNSGCAYEVFGLVT